MTHHPIRVLEDGTRVYSNGTRYKPKALEERKTRVLKPDDPRAVRWCGKWWLPMELVPEDERQMPETRPDSDAYEHMKTTALCWCDVCRRPEAERWRKKWRRDGCPGLTP